MMRSSIRKFICKRCKKPSTDELAVAHGVFADGTKWEHENLDLCKKCFKLTRREVSKTQAIREMLALKWITDEDLTKFQDDKEFSNRMFEKYNAFKNSERKKRNDKIKGVGVSPSDVRRKESRKLLQGIRGIEQ